MKLIYNIAILLILSAYSFAWPFSSEQPPLSVSVLTRENMDNLTYYQYCLRQQDQEFNLRKQDPELSNILNALISEFNYTITITHRNYRIEDLILITDNKHTFEMTQFDRCLCCGEKFNGVLLKVNNKRKYKFPDYTMVLLYFDGINHYLL